MRYLFILLAVCFYGISSAQCSPADNMIFIDFIKDSPSEVKINQKSYSLEEMRKWLADCASKFGPSDPVIIRALSTTSLDLVARVFTSARLSHNNVYLAFPSGGSLHDGFTVLTIAKDDVPEQVLSILSQRTP